MNASDGKGWGSARRDERRDVLVEDWLRENSGSRENDVRRLTEGEQVDLLLENLDWLESSCDARELLGHPVVAGVL